MGERVRNDINFKEYSKGNKTSVQGLARNLDASERTLYYAIQFYDKYHELDNVPVWNIMLLKIGKKRIEERRHKNIK